jgi:ParB family chromosome partitioning protein
MPVVLPADAGDLVTTERCACRVLVVAVRPDATGLDLAAHLVCPCAVARPDAGAQAVEGVVGDRQRVLVVFEGGDRQHRAEDLLLEHPHLVVALEHRGLEVVAVGELAVDRGALASDEDLAPSLRPMSTYDPIFSTCCLETWGPTWVSRCPAGCPA